MIKMLRLRIAVCCRGQFEVRSFVRSFVRAFVRSLQLRAVSCCWWLLVVAAAIRPPLAAPPVRIADRRHAKALSSADAFCEQPLELAGVVCSSLLVVVGRGFGCEMWFRLWNAMERCRSGGHDHDHDCRWQHLPAGDALEAPLCIRRIVAALQTRIASVDSGSTHTQVPQKLSRNML